jgi:CelD/BcsL family acetyltransferase involved in cellulose biosynthesis
VNIADTIAVEPVPIVMSVTDTFESIDRREWDECVTAVSGSLYVTYDWLRIWWRHYGRRRKLRVYQFRQAGRLIGLAPMFVETVRLGPVAIRLAKRVGADFALTMFALPLDPRFADLAYAKIIVSLINDERCAAIWFGFAPGDDPTAAALLRACEMSHDTAALAGERESVPHTRFALPATFAAYLSGLDRRQRQNYTRARKLLGKDRDIRTAVIGDPANAGDAFVRFRSCHDAQWRGEGKLGHFGDWPDAVAFNTELVDVMSRLGRVRIVDLIADGAVISSQYAFVFNACCYWRLPARATGEVWDRFSLGRLGLVQLIECMIGEGVTCIEAGMGHYDYKHQLGGEELLCKSAVVVAKRAGDARRVRLFLWMSDALHLLYYRIWFLRLAGRWPDRWLGRRRPLWRTWIRARL